MRIRHALVLAAAAIVALAPFSGEAGARAQVVSVKVIIAGSGKVTGPGIDCGLGGTTCTAQFAGGTGMTFDAKPDDKSVFASWLGDCLGTNPQCILVIPDETEVVVFAVFAAVEVVDVRMDGTGQGSVASAPAGIKCGQDCVKAFAGGTQVTLTATPKPGSVFTGWNGWCSGTNSVCTFQVSGPAYVVAHFESTAKPSGGSQGSSPQTSLVFKSLGWDVQNRNGILYAVVKFRTSEAGSVALKLRRGTHVYSAWRVSVQPGAITVRLPVPAGAPKGAYRVDAKLSSKAGTRTLAWAIRL